MEIKPPISQGPIAGPDDQIDINAEIDAASREQQEIASAGDGETSTGTTLAMKHLGTEMKGFMNTTEGFLRQSLTDQLEGGVVQDEEPSIGENSSNETALFGSPVTSAQTQSASAVTKSPDPDATAKKEAQALMDKGVKLLNQHRYNEALEAFREGFRTYPDPKFILNEGSTLLEAGRYSEAVQAYERYLSDPNAPRADEARAAMERAKGAMGGREATATGVADSQKEFEKGAIAYKEGRYEEALDAFEKAYELNPIADFKYNQAACLEKLGRPYAAADSYAEYVAGKPNAADAGKINKQIEKLRTDADKAPITATGLAGGQEWIKRGNRLLAGHHYNEAVKAFEEGFRTYPDPAFLLNKASALLDGGRYAEADQAYETYLSDPNAPRADEARAAQARARAGMNKQESQQLYDKGAKAYQEGHYQEALDAFEAAYEKNPIPEFKYNQAACLERLGRPYAAADRYAEYVAGKPNAADAEKVNKHIEKLRTDADKAPITATGLAGGQEWIKRGNRLLAEHLYDQAVNAFEEGFRTYPDPAFLLNKAAALLDGGRFAEADLAYQTYLSDPNAPRADEARAAQARARSHMPGAREATATGVAESEKLLGQGSELYKSGKYLEAFQAFERAYSLNPRAELRFNQAACLEKMGRREMAAQRYEAYLAEKPDASDAAKVQTHITKLHTDALNAARSAFDRGQAAYNAGRFKEAAGAFAEAYEQKPRPEFLYNMGAAYEKAGDTKTAVQKYQLYLSMYPQAEDADKVRQHIHKLLQATGDDLMDPNAP